MATERQQLVQQAELAAALTPLLQRLVDLLAERVAQRLAPDLAPAPDVPERRLLSLDELVALLPAAKKPETWRRWLYQRTRRNQVPGQVKIGGRLFFDRQTTLPWLENGCTSRTLDLPTGESLHEAAVSETSNRKGR